MRRLSFIVFMLIITAPLRAASQTITVTPVESHELFANPGMGWQTFHRFADEDPNLDGLPSASAYFRFYWSQVEPEEGKVDFAMFDELLAHARRAGQKLAFRIMCAGTNNDYMHVPAWLKEKGCPGFEYTYGEGGTLHWVPDMESPVFKEAHYRLIRELGARYDGHPDLDLLDIGTVGLWGEWHMSGTGVEMPSETTCLEIIDRWCDAFPMTPKVMLIGHKAGMIHAMSRGCGWRADCLGDMGGFSDTWNHMENMYPQQVEETGGTDNWMSGPVAWETCWTMKKWHDEGWCIPCIFDYALDYHGSYINNKSAKIPEGRRGEVEKVLMKLGYRLVVRKLTCPVSVKAGSPLAVTIDWENVGVAPPYRNYTLAVRLRNLSTGTETVLSTGISCRFWQPGRFVITARPAVPRDLESGTYDLSIGIVDIEKQPVVRLAVEGGDGSGWYRMTDVRVE